jgi:biopolymer transport protein ExbD
MKFSGKIKAEQPGFQIAPLIDVVFLLLIFFVTSQIYAQWEAEIEVALPSARTADQRSRQVGEIVVNIARDGSIMVGGQSLLEEKLGGILSRLAAAYPGQAVILRADRRTEYDHLIRVLDLCRRSGIWNISFATLPVEDEAADK